MSKDTALHNRLIKLLNEEEFKENTEIIKQGAVDEFADSIIKKLVGQTINNDELRDAIRSAFKTYFEEDIEVDFVKANSSDSSYNGLNEYNEYLDQFRVIFTQIEAPQEQKTALFSAVANINNFGMYYLMLFRSLSSAIYDSVDPATANMIMARAAKQIENQTAEMFANAEKVSDLAKENKKSEGSQNNTELNNVVDFKSRFGN